jgi:AraC-like DNA-binding protein
MDHIVYKEFLPHTTLAPFIDAFWTVTGHNAGPVPDKILPDGCVDIILNTGPSFSTSNGAAPMAAGEAYLIGTMTRYIEMIRPPATSLTGIRFKPGGFSFFYAPSFLKDSADRTVEFDRTLVPAINPATPDPTANLDDFFLRRLAAPAHPIQPLIADIQLAKGCISVSRLARQNFMTIRQLERLFQLHLAITPKEFINFSRFQTAIQQIRSRQANKTLLDISLDCGYYDHAHLTNEIKKYSGSAPSAF